MPELQKHNSTRMCQVVAICDTWLLRRVLSTLRNFVKCMLAVAYYFPTKFVAVGEKNVGGTGTKKPYVIRTVVGSEVTFGSLVTTIVAYKVQRFGKSSAQNTN